ncbi:LBX1 factor, partial [Probosciger aterrimus]|nr:LBX1 factor [Probosciger aterrimus]
PARLPEKAAGPRGGGIAPSSPLCALEELASKTFQGLELGLLQAAEGREPLAVPGSRPPCKKRRKSRTAFTAQQLRELEQRFLRQKYLSPVDRDRLAARLALSTAQVITWFQNRRAKLKRDLEELRADVASLQALPPAALRHLAAIPDPPLPPGPGTGPAPPPAELSEEEIDVGD